MQRSLFEEIAPVPDRDSFSSCRDSAQIDICDRGLLDLVMRAVILCVHPLARV
jgi:hypothetical protein